MKKRNQKPPSDQQIKLIRKSNELVEARYRFDIWETRVFAKMLTMIRHDDRDFQLYDIYIGDLLRDFGLQDGGDNYAAVKSAAKKLISRVIEIEKHTPEGVMWYAMPLLVGATGFKEPKDGNYIRVQFHQELRPYLLELKERYLQYDIRNLWGLSSVYSVRMYELLKQYERIGKRRFDLEDLRNRLAIAPNEYAQYGHFKDKIIKKAQEDLRLNTDIRFEFEEHKLSRSVSSITFFIASNDSAIRLELPVSKAAKAAKTAQAAAETVEKSFGELPKLPLEWGVSAEKLAILIAEKGAETVQIAIDCTLDALKKGGGAEVESPGGFFVRALENGWRSAAQARAALAESAKKEAEKRRAEAERALETAYETLEIFENERRGAANAVIRDLANDDPFLAMEAVKTILASQPLCQSLAKQTGLKIDTALGMDEWRQNKPLRDAVVVQIELLRPADFGEVKAAFDQKIKTVRERVDELRKEMGLKKS